MSKIREKCKKCGGTPNRFGKCNICEILGQAAPPEAPSKAGWPMRGTTALAVTPQSMDAANRRAKAAGLTGVHYEMGRDGNAADCIISDNGQRTKLIKLLGLTDRSGGYSNG